MNKLSFLIAACLIFNSCKKADNDKGASPDTGIFGKWEVVQIRFPQDPDWHSRVWEERVTINKDSTYEYYRDPITMIADLIYTQMLLPEQFGKIRIANVSASPTEAPVLQFIGNTEAKPVVFNFSVFNDTLQLAHTDCNNCEIRLTRTK